MQFVDHFSQLIDLLFGQELTLIDQDAMAFFCLIQRCNFLIEVRFSAKKILSMTTERERRFVGPRRGQLVFALFLVAAALLLLALIGDQTTWVSKAKLFAQPRFWPAVAVGGMVLMGGLHLYKLPWRRVSRSESPTRK